MKFHSLHENEQARRALILCNGTAPTQELLKKEAERADLIICCDAAAEYAAAAQIRVDLILGDFDSLGDERSVQLAEELHAARIEWPTHKDKTDSQLAAELAIEDGCQELVFLGALGGGRFDHALANAFLLVHCQLQGANAVIRDEKNSVRATCTHVFLHGKKGDYASVLPLGVNVQIRTTLGLAYPMYDCDLRLGDTRSVSNQFTEEEAYVEVAHGWVLVIQSHD